MTPEPDRAVAFFTGLVGWSVDTLPMPDGPYHVLKQGETPAGGIMGTPPSMPEGSPAQWYSDLAVADVDAVCRRTRELGGRVYKEPWDIPGVGRIAMIADPGGAPLGVIAPVARE